MKLGMVSLMILLYMIVSRLYIKTSCKGTQELSGGKSE